MKVGSCMVIPSLSKPSGIYSLRQGLSRSYRSAMVSVSSSRRSLSSSLSSSSSSSSSDSDSISDSNDPFTELEHKNWQRGVDAYADGFGPLTSRAVPTLLKQVGVFIGDEGLQTQGGSLLDVACGPGFVLSAAISTALANANSIDNDNGNDAAWATENREQQWSYTALDFSSNFLELAERNLGRAYPETTVSYVEGDAQNLVTALGGNDSENENTIENENTERFTAVTSNFGILHLSDPDAFLRESYRVLKPGGRLAFSAWAAPPRTEAFDLILGAVSAAGNPSVELPEGPPFFRFSDPDEIERSLEAAGFVDVTVTVVEEGMEWTNVETSEELYEILLEGTARTRELLRGQTAEETTAVRAELERRFEELVTTTTTVTTTVGGETTTTRRPLRMPAVVSSGRKPG